MTAASDSDPTSLLARVADALRRLGVRRLRLTTGLILFVYVGCHLANHALGNISLAWMERGLTLHKLVWQSIPGTLVLYPALLTHLSLGVWALYERRHYGWTVADVTQLVLGLCVPLLLAHHLVVTRIDFSVYGTVKGYAQELYSFWVASHVWGTVQVLLLIVAWIHGCIGVYFWLRLKPWFARYAPLLLVGAVLHPVLAMLGFLQGGKAILALNNDAAWRAANLSAAHVGTPVENAELETYFTWIISIFISAVVIALLARGLRTVREARRKLISLHYPDGRIVRVPRGFSVLEASLFAGVAHTCVCGGRARCSTCRVRVVGAERALPPPSEIERAVLARFKLDPTVRLACQLRPEGDIAVVPLVPAQASLRQPRRAVARGGQERFIAVLVADMRGSTQFALNHLPFDVVFTVGSFVEALGRGIAEAGGHPNQFIGDGLLAMFGVDCGPEEACRRALEAAVRIAENVAALNDVMAAEWGEPVRFGIGIHGGEAIVGEIGYRDSVVFTALGDPANVASRLQDQCKELKAEVVISETVCRLANLPLLDLPRHAISLRGRSEPIEAVAIAEVSELAVRIGARGTAGEKLGRV